MVGVLTGPLEPIGALRRRAHDHPARDHDAGRDAASLGEIDELLHGVPAHPPRAEERRSDVRRDAAQPVAVDRARERRSMPFVGRAGVPSPA
jgi:hypothetical protein